MSWPSLFKNIHGTRINTDEHGFLIGQRLNWTQMNTDKHRFYICKKHKDKRRNGTRMNTDTHGYTRIIPGPPFLKGSWEKIEWREANASFVARGRGDFLASKPGGRYMALKHGPGFRRAMSATCGNCYPFRQKILRLPWVPRRAGHGEIGACFGGRKSPLPRASPGLPISRRLNSFTASGRLGGDFREACSTKICFPRSSILILHRITNKV